MTTETPAAAIPITGKRKSRATRAAEQNGQTPAASGTTKPAAKSASKPAETGPPTARLNLGATQTTVWKPFVILKGGKKVQCPHQKYGHESERAGRACGRTLATQNGHKVA